jgi:heat-inducible transcriptional repressor
MAVLEDEGFIAQPHTSAGRIPTDLGYRAFVDSLAVVKPMSPAERRAIERFLEGAVDLDDVVSRTARLLSQLTRQVAVVRYPALSTSTVRHIELVPLAIRRLMVVLIADSGRVDSGVVETGADIDEERLIDLRTTVNAAAVGHRLPDLRAQLQQLADADPEADPLLTAVIEAVADVLPAAREERVVLGGTAHLAAVGSDLMGSVGPVLEALEEQVVLLRLFQDAHVGEVAVRIGVEQEVAELRRTSVISTGYGVGDSGAALGVIGPTRMDYPATISAVSAVARYVSRILAER